MGGRGGFLVVLGIIFCNKKVVEKWWEGGMGIFVLKKKKKKKKTVFEVGGRGNGRERE